MTDIIEPLTQIFNGRLKKNVILSPFTTFKIGGPAEYFLEANTREDIITAVKICHQYSIPLTLLGGGSNVLISDAGLEGLVIKNNTHEIRVKGMKGVMSEGTAKRLAYVETDSGVIMNYFVRSMIEQGFGGLEMHLGLPGTVGGALYMNSKWAYPRLSYVGDVLHQAVILTKDGEVETVPASYFKFGYDTSILQKNEALVISATFALENRDVAELWQTANASIKHRQKTQPQGVKSGGCMFRNLTQAEAMLASTPDLTVSAGYLIDHAGLKTVSVNDAKISAIHANFIINTHAATCADILQLVREIKKTVKDKYRVDLKEEIVVLGKF